MSTNILNENDCVFKNSEKNGWFTFFANLFHVWFNARQLCARVCFCFSLLQCFLAKVYEENRASSRYVDGTGRRSILMAFSDHCKYSLILQQNNKCSFLQMHAISNPKLYQWTSTLCFNEILWSTLYFEWVLKPCIIL